MIITMKSGKIYCFAPDQYTNLEIKYGFLILINVEQEIALFNLEDVVSVLPI